MAKWPVKRLGPHDAPWLAHVHGQAFDAPWSRNSFETLLKLPTTWGYWCHPLAVVSDPLGFILFQTQGEAAEILTFQVVEAHQQKGVGRFLLTHGLKYLGKAGAQYVYLEVAASKSAAIGLYKSQRFVITGQRKNYYKTKNGREDALVMQLSLNQSKHL